MRYPTFFAIQCYGKNIIQNFYFLYELSLRGEKRIPNFYIRYPRFFHTYPCSKLLPTLSAVFKRYKSELLVVLNFYFYHVYPNRLSPIIKSLLYAVELFSPILWVGPRYSLLSAFSLLGRAVGSDSLALSS